MVAMISKETRRVLRLAGWSEERLVGTVEWRSSLESDGFVLNAEAEQFLAEFGGIAVPEGGSGVERFRSSFELDPLLCLGESDRFEDWSDVLGRALSPVGELEEGRFMLGMDSSAILYLVSDRLGRFGSREDALDALVLGMAPQWVA